MQKIVEEDSRRSRKASASFRRRGPLLIRTICFRHQLNLAVCRHSASAKTLRAIDAVVLALGQSA
jgi:hypothetical protein